MVSIFLPFMLPLRSVSVETVCNANKSVKFFDVFCVILNEKNDIAAERKHLTLWLSRHVQILQTITAVVCVLCPIALTIFKTETNGSDRAQIQFFTIILHLEVRTKC